MFEATSAVDVNQSFLGLNRMKGFPLFGFRFRVWGLGFRVWGLGFRDLGFRV